MKDKGSFTSNTKVYRPSSVWSLVGIVLYRFTLDLIYIYQVNPGWAYSGFTIDYSTKRYILTWIILIISIPFIQRNYKSNKPSSAVITLLYLIAFIPATVLMAFKPMEGEFLILLLLYWIMLTIFQKVIPYFKFKEVNPKESNLITNIVLITFSVVILYISFRYTHFRINLNIFNVYELREEARDFNMFILLKYIYATSRVILPTIIVYFLSRKKRMIALWLGFIQLLIFSVDGSKSVLFSLILAFGGYVIYKKNRISWFAWILFLINIIAILEKSILETTNVMSIFIRRLMFLPQLLNYFYYDFFSKNQFDYFRQSFVGKLGLNSPYDIRIPNIIGNNYYGSSANNGLFADAFYNMGLIGVIIMPFLIITALRFLDACTAELDSRIIIASIITSSLNLISSSFFTVMLSHGFLAVCIVLFYLPRRKLNLAHNK